MMLTNEELERMIAVAEETDMPIEVDSEILCEARRARIYHYALLTIAEHDYGPDWPIVRHSAGEKKGIAIGALMEAANRFGHPMHRKT